jgi:hypothetical protein
MARSVTTLIHSLCDHFMLIYDAWDEHSSDALAKKMLEGDVTRLGLYLGMRDEFGQLTQLTLVAECIAYIRMYDSGMDVRRGGVDYWIDVVLEEVQRTSLHSVSQKQSIRDVVEQLETWGLVRELMDRGRIAHDTVATLTGHFLELADLFFTRTGTVSTREMKLMRELEIALIIH